MADVRLCAAHPPARFSPPLQAKVLEKTAQFVALKGALFEDRLRAAEIANPKFAFLLPDSSEHAEFRSRVAFHLSQAPAVAPEASEQHS